MSNEIQPNPRFTGLFIPAEILMMEELTPTDHMLLAWIDALYSDEHGGCYASNEYFAQKLHLKPGTVKDIITKLAKLDLVERVSFDGRQRVIRACKEKWFQKKSSQSPSASDYNRPLPADKTATCKRIKPLPTYIYSKEEIKDNNSSAPSADDAKKKPIFSSSSAIKKRKHVDVTDEQHQKLVAKYGGPQTEKAYDFLDDWKSSKSETDPTALKKHTDYYRITKWVMKEILENPRSSYKRPASKLSLPNDGKIDHPDAEWRKKRL